MKRYPTFYESVTIPKSELETLKAQLAKSGRLCKRHAGLISGLGRDGDCLACDSAEWQKQLRDSEAQVRELRELLTKSLAALVCTVTIFEDKCDLPEVEKLIEQMKAALRSAPPSAEMAPSSGPEMYEKMPEAFQAFLTKTNAGEERKDLARRDVVSAIKAGSFSHNSEPEMVKECIIAGLEEMWAAQDLAAQIPAAPLSNEGSLHSQTNTKADALGGDATRAERAVTGREPSPEPRTGNGDVTNLSSKACSGPQDSPSSSPAPCATCGGSGEILIQGPCYTDCYVCGGAGYPPCPQCGSKYHIQCAPPSPAREKENRND